MLCRTKRFQGAQEARVNVDAQELHLRQKLEIHLARIELADSACEAEVIATRPQVLLKLHTMCCCRIQGLLLSLARGQALMVLSQSDKFRFFFLKDGFLGWPFCELGSKLGFLGQITKLR